MKERYIGIMSGTSLDGVDCALTAVGPQSVELQGHISLPIPAQLKARLLSLSLNQPVTVEEMGELDHLLGGLYADAVLALLEKYQLSATDITAIGNHGQTVFHRPDGPAPFTIQLGDAHLIATRTGITTVADFRRRDMALGGQGAPLVPAFHRAVFASGDSGVVVLNIGGIANISLLHPSMPVTGYDTGPGNTLMDAWVQKYTGEHYDKDAALARQGRIDQALLDRMLGEDYFGRDYPKSTGRELFNLAWLETHLTSELSHADILATLCELTARTIAGQVERFACGDAPELLVCGGGARNPLLMERLAALLPLWQVATTDSRGVSGEFMEAMAFAWLARQRIHNLPSNVPEVTGARQAVSLGVIYPAD